MLLLFFVCYWLLFLAFWISVTLNGAMLHIHFSHSRVILVSVHTTVMCIIFSTFCFIGFTMEQRREKKNINFSFLFLDFTNLNNNRSRYSTRFEYMTHINRRNTIHINHIVDWKFNYGMCVCAVFFRLVVRLLVCFVCLWNCACKTLFFFPRCFVFQFE